MAFKHCHLVSSAVQLHGGCKPGRTAADNGYFFSSTDFRRVRTDQSGVPGVFNNGTLVGLCRHRISVEIAGAGSLAQRRAYPGGKLRKTVGFRQAIIRLFPVSMIHQIVPLRHQIIQRAAGSHAGNHASGLAERHAACHTAGSLELLFFWSKAAVKFMKVLDTFQRRNAGPVHTLIF